MYTLIHVRIDMYIYVCVFMCVYVYKFTYTFTFIYVRACVKYKTQQVAEEMTAPVEERSDGGGEGGSVSPPECDNDTQSLLPAQ